MKRGLPHFYLPIIITAIAALSIIFNFFPRPTFSELEKRDLKTFPTLSMASLKSGEFTTNLSLWFSDTEPFRDLFMQLSMQIKDWQRTSLLSSSEENLTFYAAAPSDPPPLIEDTIQNDEPIEDNNRTFTRFEHQDNKDENAKIAHAGIIIVGSDNNTRALMAFGGSPESGLKYADIVNQYARKLADSVQVYCMVIPTAIEFYCPEKARKNTKSQHSVISNLYAALSDSVKAVDIYTPLSEHVNEAIYLRTDHHWAPLGAYYAAQKFARVASAPFSDLNTYKPDTIRRYVGSMYAYSKDISVKKAPEDFIFHLPADTAYSTTYIDYHLDENYKITSRSNPHKGNFFHHFKDGSGNAYCTFMGTDNRITQVKTSLTTSNRRLLILKDSFGNPIPAYLLSSFNEIHVVDFRYFDQGLLTYIRDHQITDLLFANNIFMACSANTIRKYRQYFK